MATSTLTTLTVDERLLQCTICVDRIKNPVTLNCMHSYCLSCLENWRKKKGQVTCPTCRKQYRMTADDLKKLPPHTLLNNLLETIEQFERTAEKWKKTAQQCRQKLDNSLKEVIENSRKLEQSREQCLKDIDNHENKMIKKIKDRATELRNEVEIKYINKKRIPDVQMEQLQKTIADVDSKVNNLDQLLKSDRATAVESSDEVIKALKDRIQKLPKTEPDDNERIYYFENKQAIQQLCDIGEVTELRPADCLELQGVEPVTQGQNIVVEITKSVKIQENSKPKVKWTKPTGETVNVKIDETSNGDYTVKTRCTSTGDYRINVSVDDEPIKNSPMIINVEEVGLVNTIQINEPVRDVVKWEEDYLLVSSRTNKIHKYKQSGEYVCDIILPRGVKVFRMYMMKNGNLVFSDRGNKCIQVCNMNMEIINSIGKEVLKDPFGVYVDEKADALYVTDWDINAVITFDITSGMTSGRIERLGLDGQISNPCDVHLTKQGHIHLLDSTKSLLSSNTESQSFDDEGRSNFVFVKEGDKDGCVRNPRGVAIDDDDNIIITSKNKVQLFSSDGKLIKRIDKQGDGINGPRGITFISSHPRKIAVANRNGKNVKIFNY